MLPGVTTESQRATIKYFVIVALLFLAQVLVGGATAHYRADPGSFYGIDLSRFFPSNIFRTWHLAARDLLDRDRLYCRRIISRHPPWEEKNPRGQAKGVNLLFLAVVIVALGSLLGEMLGVYQLLGKLWFWFGHQGWEYLDLGRAWQVLLAIGLVFWLVLIVQGNRTSQERPGRT